MANQFRCEVKRGHGDVFLYGTIGGDWFGGVTADEVAKDIHSMGDIKTLSIYVNSLGGNVFDGIAIRSAFMRSNAEIDVTIDGVAASAASVAISIPDIPVVMAAGSRYMIHNPWGFGVGESDELRKTADLLDSIRSDLIDIYESRADGLSVADIGKMMDDETWLGAADAIGYGFATDMSEQLAVAACACPEEMRRKLKHVPDELFSVVEPTEDDDIKEDDEEPSYNRLLMSRYRVARAKSG